MTSMHTQSRQRWDRRATAILNAIVALSRADLNKREFTAAEVALVVAHGPLRDCWSEKQREELTTWIQRAGRHEFDAFLNPPRAIASAVHGGIPVRYHQGVFVIELRVQ